MILWMSKTYILPSNNIVLRKLIKELVLLRYLFIFLMLLIYYIYRRKDKQLKMLSSIFQAKISINPIQYSKSVGNSLISSHQILHRRKEFLNYHKMWYQVNLYKLYLNIWRILQINIKQLPLKGLLKIQTQNPQWIPMVTISKLSCNHKTVIKIILPSNKFITMSQLPLVFKQAPWHNK